MASDSDKPGGAAATAAAAPAPVATQPMKRPGYGTAGTTASLSCNHYRVTLSRGVDVAQYSVKISYANDPNEKALIEKVANRRVMEKVRTELGGGQLIFDGESTLYVVGKLSFGEKDMEVTLDKAAAAAGPAAGSAAGSSAGGAAKKRRADASSYKVRIKFSTKIDLGVLMQKEALHLPRAQDALRVLDVLVRQQAARREYVQLRESYFHSTLGPVQDVGEGVQSWSGYHASFRPCSLGLSLNLDPSTTIVIKPQLVHEFVSEYLRKPPTSRFSPEEYTRAKKILKGIMVEVYAGTKHKIFNFSEQPSASQRFELKEKAEDGTFKMKSTTVADYYRNRYNETLRFPHLLCANVGKANRAVYVPMEFCRILPGQRYKRKLNGNQIRKHLERARQLPSERAEMIRMGVSELRANSEKDLQLFNVKIDKDMMQVRGRVLPPPMLKFGKGNVRVTEGKWNYNNETVALAAKVSSWIVLSFAQYSQQEVSRIANQLKTCFGRKGFNLPDPALVLAEDRRFGGRPSVERVSAMVGEARKRCSERPGFVLCVLPSKESDIYAPFKRAFLTNVGVPTQCIAPPRNASDQYFTNVMLKINAKCNGYNTVLTHEFERKLPKLSSVRTMLVGMDVSHASPHSNTPSIAAMVGSYDWPRITRFAARVLAQARNQEAFANVQVMMEDLLNTFKANDQGKAYPEQLIIFRDGVSESQFESVLTEELQEIVKTCEKLKIRPKLTLIVAQKRHHTRFFPNDPKKKNVDPGTIVDRDVTHPSCYDFFLCSHKGIIGTSRPTHYVVLYDEIGFTPDEIQSMVNNLCYTYVKSTTAVSVVAPINYAHLAAKKMRTFLSLDSSETGSTGTASTATASIPIPTIPALMPTISDTMFYV